MLTNQSHMVKVHSILRWVEVCEQSYTLASKEKMIAQGGEVWGTSRRTFLEYLKELEVGEKIVIDKDEVMTVEKYNQRQRAKSSDYLTTGLEEGPANVFPSPEPENSSLTKFTKEKPNGENRSSD